MLARRTLTRAVAQPSPLGAAPQNARNMATLREIELRLKSVRNIEKITKVNRSLLSGTHGKAFMFQISGLVYENDCLDQTLEGPAGHASWQAVWTSKRW
jgi:F-type H+-transporting ATPase subunit gamma